MGRSLFCVLLICIACITRLSFTLHTGQDFITAFLQNSNTSMKDSKFEFIISAFSDMTRVSVLVTKQNLSWSLNLNNGETQTIGLPREIEMVGSGFFDLSVLIIADQDISVTMRSSKTNSTDRTLVLPVDYLDNDYYVVTPSEYLSEKPVDNLKEFAIVNYDLPSRVQIYVKGWVLFDGANVTSDNPLIINLRPFQVFQLQSSRDLSGTRVTSTNLVAVLSGVTCTWKNKRCAHIYEQLYPVSYWGRQYEVVPIPYQTIFDILYVTASQYTQLNLTMIFENVSIVISSGEVFSFPIMVNELLQISANVSIQVLYYCTGGVTRDLLLDPFFIELPDISKFCTKYQVQGLQDVTNAVLIISKTSSVSGIRFNRLNLIYLRWKKIPGTEYSWSLWRYGRQNKTNVVSHSSSAISVLNVGIAPNESYGLSGVCLMSENPCANKQCRKKESCVILGNKAACIPDGEAICQIWGDPHFLTFDGLKYNFQGTCTYTVAKSCMDLRDGGDTTLPEFAIEAKYNNRRSGQSSYIESVTIHIDEYNITMVQYEFGIARVNNIRWDLPIFLDDGRIRIMATGFHALLETSFIRIRYDWNVFLFIKIPSSFFENVCGLCGNYNDNKDDDFETFEGVKISDLKEFGKSWKVTDECSSCWDDCHWGCQPVAPTNEMLYYGVESCGIISYIYGPFYRCHSVVKPAVYFNACVNDMVKNGGYKKVLCDAISVYLVACHVQGVRVEDWRTHIGCEMECPDNSWYNPCGNPCPETCAGELSLCQEQVQCMETCQCYSGFVLHTGSCIPKDQCGSFCNGRYYPPETKFWGDGGCTQQCWCEMQSVKCSSNSCPSGEECAVMNGIRDCYATSYGHCTTFGNLHYKTFDGLHFDFHGSCQYQLSGLCDKTRNLTDFTVEMSTHQDQHAYSSRSLMIKVYGVEILLSKENKGRAKLNGIIYNFPLTLIEDHIQVFMHGWDGVILTKFGLKVTFDWNRRVTVTLPAAYYGAVCGLCGNFNGDTQDEMTIEKGGKPQSVTAFAASWRTTDKSKLCREMEMLSCPLVHDMEKVQRKKFIECGIILKHGGPFRDCHNLVNPEEYFQSCIYDYCLYSARQDVYCKTIEAYTAACQDLNGTVYAWREGSFCKTWCPSNSVYTLDSSGYPKTCSGLSLPFGCHDLRRESCDCKDGYLLDVDHCVLPWACGCVLYGVYYKTNEEFFPTPDCRERCVCGPGGLVKCQPFSCRDYEICKLVDGIRKCHPTEEASCSVTSGSYYQSFDGLSFSFYAKCTYVLTKSCYQTLGSLPVDFSVFISVAATQKIIVFVNDIKIAITEGTYGTIQVNDSLFSLPLDLKNKGIQVYQQGISVVLNTSFGLELTYDLASQVQINISSSFLGEVCGLCGNYNGDAMDDFQLPGGTQGTNITSFSKAWQDSSLGIPCENKQQFGGPCKNKETYEGNLHCGMLLVRGGHFSACHDFVAPFGYFEECVSEHCQGGEEINLKCKSLQSYAFVCQNMGIAGLKWRDGFCALECPQNSHYESCADTCKTTCAAVVAPSACSSVCVEGCQCNDGFYLDRDQCVPLTRCGCYIEGRYFSQNETFLIDNCKENCICGVDGAVRCLPNICPGKCIQILENTFRCQLQAYGGH